MLRNPWGRLEPAGSNTFQGVVTIFDVSFWRPIDMAPNDGIFAIEATDFKTFYEGMGVAVA
jgi:hypothetical protein